MTQQAASQQTHKLRLTEITGAEQEVKVCCICIVIIPLAGEMLFLSERKG